MPKDNRRILSSVRVTGKPLFKDGMEDELAAELGQQRLDQLKNEGVLAGDWRSTKQGGGGFSVTGDAPSREFQDRMNSENVQMIGADSKEFVPLSAEEAMRRFQEFDFSDEVMRSMQFHKEAIKTKVGSVGENASKTKDESNSGKSDSGSRADNSDSSNANSDNTNGANDSDSANSNDSKDDEEFPADFPARSKFIKANKTFAEIKTLTREKLIEIDGIAEKTADEVIAYLSK